MAFRPVSIMFVAGLVTGMALLDHSTLRAAHARAAVPQPRETVGITFLTPSLGWRLAVHWDGTRGMYGPLFVARTQDGGITWRTISRIPNGTLLQQGAEGLRVSDILFASRLDGWAYGTRLYSTHDGGRSWRRLAFQGTSTNISVAGRSVWRVDTRCAGISCHATLLTSTVGSDDWRRAVWQPPRSWGSASLTRANASVAWLLSSELPASPNHITRRLLGTTDGGKNWHALPIPCAAQGPIGDVLVASGSRHLWAFCASEPSAGQQFKTADRSDDGGEHWRLVSASGKYGLRNLSSSGYLDGAALTSPSSAWLALGRGTLLHSGDNGRIWRPAIPYSRADPGGGGVGPVTFVDSRHGWLLSFPFLLFRTVDGGRHWQEIRLS